MLNSYRARLIAFLCAIACLVSATLAISYYSARRIIWEDADLHLQRTAQFYERNLEELRLNLAQYADIMRDDLRVQEYSYAVIRIGTGNEALRNLLDERFSRLPVDAILISWNDGAVERGGDAALREAILKMPAGLLDGTFYLELGKNLYLVASLPLTYHQEELGRVSVATRLDTSWLLRQPRDEQSHLFFAHAEHLLAGTHPGLEQIQFQPEEGTARIQGERFSMVPIRLPGTSPPLARLWLAQSESALVETLNRYNRLMLGLTVLILGVLLTVSLLAVNGFSRPIRRLIELTREMAEGRLPTLQRPRGDNELDVLLNQFIDLIEALRNKQQEVEEAHQRLQRSATTDELTGLYNRRHLNELYPKLLAQAEREGLCLFAVLLDIDHFKQINDNHGHAAGDACLQHFAAILTTNTRNSDFVFRMGGEEFLVLTMAQDVETASGLAEKIRHATETGSLNYGGSRISFTVSGGVGCMGGTPRMAGMSGSQQSSLSRLVSISDHALYVAKRAGRNRIHLSEDCCGPNNPCGRSGRKSRPSQAGTSSAGSTRSAIRRPSHSSSA
ncbi:diguanylate cyclase [Thiohalobacter sp. IOR34]|uniref:sensor domain-containing diguanylate cyclase n=1 Tax=Thiohalobacter sp. IOR34 TaxID=3057176 RepID=UPI0025AFC8A7|nr:diguanylate cyclase [Thiohalobacter sp. IOR34]WJW75912.1 diguanylate cyclase [Thiohalobacter sp. IOR34]